ncbi:MAG TPA: RidA family protein [Paracoccaceae bacterium]|nr:RidA family protein [Paracoccaceae bacterium]
MALKKQRFITEKVAEYPPGHWSNTIRVGDQIWLSGFTSRGSDRVTIHGVGDAYEQAKVIFQKIKDCLENAGSGLQDVVNMNIYVTNMADNKEIWRARQEFFTGDFPCSTLVQVAGLGTPEILLEITCQAMAGSGA